MGIPRLVFLFMLLALPACTTLVTSAAGQGAMIAAQERSTRDAVSDARIQLEANNKLLQYSTRLFSQVDLTVTEGSVLLTGNVPSPEDRIKAAQLVWEIPGVRQVNNELSASRSQGAAGYAQDSWILAKLRSQMVFAEDIVSINYTLDCVDGVVYIMGVAQDQGEVERVIALARNISGVKGVKSYVRLKAVLPGIEREGAP